MRFNVIYKPIHNLIKNHIQNLIPNFIHNFIQNLIPNLIPKILSPILSTILFLFIFKITNCNLDVKKWVSIVAGCMVCNLDWAQYIEPYHNLTTLSQMWHYEFHLIPNESYWTFPLAHDWKNYGTIISNKNLKKKKGEDKTSVF